MSRKKNNTYKVGFLRSDELAKDTTAFYFKKPGNFDFRAGQHVKLKLESEDLSPNFLYMTIASSPKERELCFATRMTGSDFKRALESLEPGEKILMSGAMGNFYISPQTGVRHVFVSGGIGATASRSMLKDIHDSNSEKMEDAILITSNKQELDIPFRDEFYKMREVGLELTEVVTRDSNWSGPSERIDRNLIEETVGDTMEAVYYVTGTPEMVYSIRKILEEMGVEDNFVSFEQFSGY